MTGECAGTLGEDDERHAFLEYFTGIVVSLADFAGAAAVDIDVMGVLAGHAEEWYLAQRFLHHPFEVAVKESVNEEYVERALVVSHEDVALLRVEVLTTFDTDWQKEQIAGEASPPLAGIVTPEVSVAKTAADGGYRRRDNAQNEEYR